MTSLKNPNIKTSRLLAREGCNALERSGKGNLVTAFAERIRRVVGHEFFPWIYAKQGPVPGFRREGPARTGWWTSKFIPRVP